MFNKFRICLILAFSELQTGNKSTSLYLRGCTHLSLGLYPQGSASLSTEIDSEECFCTITGKLYQDWTSYDSVVNVDFLRDI